MSSTVRFLDTHNQTKKVSSYSDGTQTIPIEFNSSGTDPVAAPERGTQTDQRFLWNKTAAQSLRIDAQLVDNILKELEAVEREWPLFDAYQQRRHGGEITKERLLLRLVKNEQLPRNDSNTSTAPNATITALCCGPASRMVLLLGESQHDSWCTDHIVGRLLFVHRHQTHDIPLPACPSDVLFGRYGEILIVGLYTGEILLISGAQERIGEVLWSSGASTLHSRAVTQLQWVGVAFAAGGTERRELFSIGLDGKVLRSRLEPNNRLEPLQSLQIALNDLPRSLRKAGSNMSSNRAIGLVGMLITGQRELFVATETGALLLLDSEQLRVKEAIELADSNGLEQIATTFIGGKDEQQQQQKGDGGIRHFVWRTSDGRVRQGLLQQGSNVMDDVKLLPIGLSKQREFCLFSPTPTSNPLLLVISEPAAQQVHQQQQQQRKPPELLGWDLAAGELVLRDAQAGEHLEAIVLDQRAGDLLIGVSVTGGGGGRQQHKQRQLVFYEVGMD